MCEGGVGDDGDVGDGEEDIAEDLDCRCCFSLGVRYSRKTPRACCRFMMTMNFLVEVVEREWEWEERETGREGSECM
jgi:hypothetical protein